MKTMQECPQFENCAAPLCPLHNNLSHAVWYSDEDICIAIEERKALFVRNQRKIAKRCRDNDTFFTYDMLNHKYKIVTGISGLDPDKVDVIGLSSATTQWLKSHPDQKELTDEEKQIQRERMTRSFANSKPIKNDSTSR